MEARAGDTVEWAVPEAAALVVHAAATGHGARLEPGPTLGGRAVSTYAVAPQDGVVRVRVVEGEARLLLARTGVALTSGPDGARLEAQGDVPAGECRATHLDAHALGARGARLADVNASGAGLRFVLRNAGLDAIAEGKNTLDHRARQGVLLLQACAADAAATYRLVVRDAGPVRATPAPLLAAAAALVAASCARRCAFAASARWRTP